jgi:hypothetical protein
MPAALRAVTWPIALLVSRVVVIVGWLIVGPPIVAIAELMELRSGPRQ